MIDDLSFLSSPPPSRFSAAALEVVSEWRAELTTLESKIQAGAATGSQRGLAAALTAAIARAEAEPEAFSAGLDECDELDRRRRASRPVSPLPAAPQTQSAGASTLSPGAQALLAARQRQAAAQGGR